MPKKKRTKKLSYRTLQRHIKRAETARDSARFETKCVERKLDDMERTASSRLAGSASWQNRADTLELELRMMEMQARVETARANSFQATATDLQRELSEMRVEYSRLANRLGLERQENKRQVLEHETAAALRLCAMSERSEMISRLVLMVGTVLNNRGAST